MQLSKQKSITGAPTKPCNTDFFVLVRVFQRREERFYDCGRHALTMVPHPRDHGVHRPSKATTAKLAMHSWRAQHLLEERRLGPIDGIGNAKEIRISRIA